MAKGRASVRMQAQIKRMAEQGYSIRSIAQALKISRRIQWLWVEFGKEDEGSSFTLRAAGDVDAGVIDIPRPLRYFPDSSKIPPKIPIPGAGDRQFPCVHRTPYLVTRASWGLAYDWLKTRISR